MSKFNGFFRDWNIDCFCASHPDGRKLWIANGFLFFDDAPGRTACILGFGFIDKWRLWRELRREVRRRQWELQMPSKQPLGRSKEN